MSAKQDNIDTVTAWVKAINDNDIEAELACWCSDGEFTIASLGTTFHGVDEIRAGGEQSANLVGAQPAEGRKQITHINGAATWTVVEYDAHATITGPLIVAGTTLLADGEQREVVTHTCVVFLMKEGKLWRGQEYFDTTAMAEQLGLSPDMLARMYASLAEKR